MRYIVDHLAKIEAAVPGLAGHIDPTRVAAVGYSLGGHTVAMLAGMRVTDPATGEIADLSEPRIKAVIMFSPPGGGADLAPWAAEHYPVLGNGDFTHMTRPALVVTGDNDFNPQFSERRDWRADAYRLSPGPKSLLIVKGAEHIFGGISGYDAKETSDENPERVAEIQRMSWAYLHTALYPDDTAWNVIVEGLANADNPAGKIESK